jgi:hypothetical protein
MYQIDNSTAATVQAAPSLPGTPGFFTDGNPGAGSPATILPAEWLNAVQQELINAVVAAGITPSKSLYNQLAQAIKGAGFVPWNSVLAAGTGYADGALVQRGDGSGGWINTVAGNATDPDTGGAGWVPCLGSSAILSLALTTGTVTPSALQAASAIISLTGTLTGNVTIVMPAWVGTEWTFIDSTTRAGFTVTVKTASGTSVAISQNINFLYCNSGGVANCVPSGLVIGTPTEITSTTMFVPDPRARSLRIRGSAGGAAGGGAVTTTSTTASAGSGAGCGSCIEAWITGPLAASYSAVVGAAGTGTVGASGTNGGNSTFTGTNVSITLTGGGGGLASTAGPGPFLGNGNVATTAPTASGSALSIVSLQGPMLGGGCFVMTTSAVANAGGRGVANLLGNTAPATGYGTGGSGANNGASTSATAGGPGTPGVWIVEQFT